ncbi:MAG: hypothetical protein GY737_11315 [Desulfobacteraceae bacterium]|nr:hypothetical protein [Desulfobacteraceae bacterium]
MPEGSLNTSISTLRTALEGVVGLLGVPGDEGTPASGFAGAAGAFSVTPQQHFDDFSGQITRQLSGVLDFDSGSVLGGVTDLFSSLEAGSDLIPVQALQELTGFIQQLDGIFSGDFITRIQDALNAITGISESIPSDRAGVAGALVDQVIGVLMSLEGPEAEAIRAWIDSIRDLFREAMPLIDLAQSADPEQAMVEAFQRSLDNTLNAFNYGAIKKVVDFVQAFPPRLSLEDQLGGIPGAITNAATALFDVQGAVGADFTDYRNAIAGGMDALEGINRAFRPAVKVLNSIVNARLLQPNALENYLREQMNKALDVHVHEVQKIDDPFNLLLDRIDEGIENVDLSFVRDEVLGFFGGLQENIEGADIPSLGDTLAQQLAPVSGAVDDLQQGVTDFLAQIEGFADNINDQLRNSLGTVGEFQADGSFRYHFEGDLETLLVNARRVIAGDPGDPGAVSLSGTLDGLNAAINELLGRVLVILQEVEALITGVTDTAVGGINEFRDFVEGLNVQQLLDTLKEKIETILNDLAPIEFDLIVDPIVAELDENTEKLRSVDVSSLNDLLREALKLALDVVVSINFTDEISTPLKDQFENVKAVPQSALDTLQARYEQAISELDELSPTRLLQDIFSAFDIIEDAVKDLTAASLLAPLDGLHEQYLQQPFDKLAPSTLLQPVTDGFENLTAVFDAVNGGELIGPVNTLLNDFKSRMDGFDITSRVDDLLEAVEGVKQDLRDIRPSELFGPIVQEFERLESELDRFKPSIVFQPVVELATPLLAVLENVQAATSQALHDAFQIPLQILDQLQPEALTRQIQQHLDEIITGLNGVNFPARYNQLKGQYFDFKTAVEAEGNTACLSIISHVDPERKLGHLMGTCNGLIQSLETIKNNVVMPDLEALYAELQERLLGMLPPFARRLLDPETFKRVMRLANPVRFLEALDERFEEIKNRLLPIRPGDITGELDETYDTVLALVEGLDIEDGLNLVKDQVNQVKDIAATIRVDFLASDIDNAINDVKAVVDALDPAGVISRLDILHNDLKEVLDLTLPSAMLSGIDTILEQVQGVVALVDPETSLGQPLNLAWQAVADKLAGIDFTVVLQPLVDKLDELEQKFEQGLGRTETSFDRMLGSARSALSDSASASAGAGASI